MSCNRLTCLFTRSKINSSEDIDYLSDKLDECNNCVLNETNITKHKTRNILGAKYVSVYNQKIRR